MYAIFVIVQVFFQDCTGVFDMNFNLTSFEFVKMHKTDEHNFVL